MMNKLFALMYIKEKKLLGFSVSSNGDNAECCGDTRWELDMYGDNVWIAKSREAAEDVRTTNVKWYNSSYDHPMNDFKSDDLKIVELEIKEI